MVDPAWVALSLIDHVGAKKLTALLRRFGDPATVLRADNKALQEVRGIGPKIAAAIGAVDVARVEAAIPRWQAEGVRLLTVDDLAYPFRLRAVDDAPPTLFMRGELGALDASFVAVVGTRQPTAFAAQAASEIGSMLAKRGVVVVSGLALGVDAAAHIGALGGGGRTVAVLGCGVLQIYPERHHDLAQAIVRQGAVVSEVEPTASPNPASLVARNRIISGLSDAVIVVETGVDGGAMHAARRAFEQGRPVYALDVEAGGNRALIAQGAHPLDRDLKGVSSLP